ncbi:MAG: hypothetical protein RL488_886 [Actinomycetota bacterium]|jgi:hypothetical protein
MTSEQPLDNYLDSLDSVSREIFQTLLPLVRMTLPEAVSKVWHGHPVWFINENPILGVSRKKAGVELLFWSGQSFETSGLKPIGKFKAAGISFSEVAEIDKAKVNLWLDEGKTIQWDYANLPKRRELVRLEN